MLGLVAGTIWVGYLLVYAAVANGGKFAAEPWRALREDAYTGGRPGAHPSSPHSGGSWITKVIPWVIPGMPGGLLP